MDFAGLRRLFHIAIVLLRHGLAHFAAKLVSRVSFLARRLPATDLSGPDRLRTVMEDLGGSFIKLGQMMALQPDILPVEYCDALYNLLDHVPPVPSDESVQVFVDDIGRSPDDVFDEFHHQPLASGSIGQVHVAWKDGTKYAVKIQRPDAQANFARDIRLMTSLVRLVTVLRMRWLSWMLDPLNEFAKWTAQELDFRREAKFMEILRRNAMDNPHERVPAILDEFSTRRILVVEFLHGVTLMDHIRHRTTSDEAYTRKLDEMGFVPETFAENIIDNFLDDAFDSGVFHADLHPANLMLLRDNCVGYVDFGITGVISEYSRHNLVAMTLAYSRKDLDTMCARFFDVSSMDEESDPEGFRKGLKRLAESWYQTRDGESSLKITTTSVMLDMLTLSRRTRILPQRDVVLYIRASIAIDGLIRQFAPDFNVNQYLAASCRRHLTAQARKSLLSHDTIVNWSRASAALLQTGAFRVSGLLEQMAIRRPAL